MKKLYFNLCTATALLTGLNATAQMSGAYSVPGSFPTLAAAVASLNTVGVNGPVTINITGGYTETAPAGGYALTATGTGANSITFQKSGAGANPLLTAYSGGTGTPGSPVQDGIFRLIGSDFISIVNIDLIDLNTTNPATMEFGYGLYKASAADGCQHIIIASCNITLSTANNAAGIMPAVAGSRGIDMVNATPAANTTMLTVTTAGGTNSNNGFFANTIRNCNYGIALVGFNAASPFTFSDAGTNISSDNIFNFGGASSAANPAGGIITFNQQGLVITGNTFNNNDGAGINHPNDLHGIYVNTAGGSEGNISGNNLSLHGGGTTHTVTVIEVAGTVNTPGSSLNINGNTIRGCTYPTATSGNFYGIFNSSPCDMLGINGNLFATNSTAASTGAYYSIYNSGNVASGIYMNANTMDTVTFTAASVSSTVCGIYCSGAGSLANAGISGNTFKHVNFTGATGGTGIYSAFRFTANADTVNLTGNNFIDLNLKTSGTVYLIYNSSATPMMNVFGNNIGTGFTRTANAGDTYFYYGNGSTASGTVSISYNNVTNISQAGTSGFYGIYTAANTLQKQIASGNTFDAISSGSGITSIISMTAGNASTCSNNTISNITVAGTLYGINCNAGIAANTVSQNTLFSMMSSGASTVFPVYLAAGTQANVSQNKIYDISTVNAGGSVYGIYTAANTVTITAQTDTIVNNLIGDMKAPAASGAMPLAGIYTAGGTNVHVYFNTVYLTASSSASLFGSSALFASSATGLDLKNNILVNGSTSSGTGITSAYRRSSTNLSTYLTGSDNNLFYAGPTSLGNSIFYDGTTAYPFLSDYKTLVSGRDVLSVTENPPFISTLGSDPNYLDLDQSIATQIESGATPIATVQGDYTASTRNNTTPDIGAWENNYTATGDVLYPTLLNAGFTTNNCSTTARTLTVSLTDVSGIASGALSPKVYYKVNAGPYSSVQGTLTSGTVLNGVWTFSLTYTAVLNNIISYYIVAQDIAGTPNVLSSPTAGFAGSNVNTITTAPTALYTYSVLPIAVSSIPSATVCSGNTASLTVTATGASTYAWSGPLGYTSTSQTAIVPSVTNTSAGVYTVTVTGVTGCSATATASLTVNISPVVAITSSSLTICSGQSVSLSATGASNYTWTPGNLNSQTISVSPVSTTTYTATGTNTLGCTNTASVTIAVNVCAGINEPSLTGFNAGLFPNPSHGNFTVTMSFDGEKEIIVTNTLGETVQHLYTTNTNETINLTGSAKGIYIIKVMSAGYNANSKLILE